MPPSFHKKSLKPEPGRVPDDKAKIKVKFEVVANINWNHEFTYDGVYYAREHRDLKLILKQFIYDKLDSLDPIVSLNLKEINASDEVVNSLQEYVSKLEAFDKKALQDRIKAKELELEAMKKVFEKK